MAGAARHAQTAGAFCDGGRFKTFDQLVVHRRRLDRADQLRSDGNAADFVAFCREHGQRLAHPAHRLVGNVAELDDELRVARHDIRRPRSHAHDAEIPDKLWYAKAEPLNAVA